MSGLRSQPENMKPMSDSIKVLMDHVGQTKMLSRGAKIHERQTAVKEEAKNTYKKSYENGYTQAMLDMIYAEQAISDAPQESDESLRSSVVEPPTLQ